MDDVYLISLAKTEYREGYNTADVERVLSVFSESFTNMSDGDCSFFFVEGKPALREQLECLFATYRVQMLPVVINIVPNGGAATESRDIIQTSTCQNCHGQWFAGHGGDRMTVENCVTCHTPGSTDAQSGN